jgi:serine/threonine protein kinase
LVVKRDGSGIYVKFADFGLSKAATLLQSFCGTPTYLAPEIYLKAADPKGTAEDTYGVAVDVWSLGVVVASLECGGLPEYRAEWTTDTTAWVTIVRDYVCDEYQRQDSALLYMIVDNMLVIDPDERSSADFCYDEAQRLLPCNGEPDNSGNASRTPISLVGLANAEDTTYSSDASTIRPYSSPCGLGSGGTIIKAEHSLGSHSRCAGRTKPNVPSKRDAQALTGRSSKLRLSRNSITHNSGAGTYVKYGDTTSRHLETPNLSSTICKTKTPCSLGHVSRSRS